MSAVPFEVTELALPGVKLIRPKIFADTRGISAVPYDAAVFSGFGVAANFVQDYVSRSKKNVLRGFHFQRAPHVQDKLVRCSTGEILDVVVDHEPSSPTYGRHVAVTLQASEQAMLYIPGKYAHGFCVLSDEAVTEYKMSDTYHPESAGGVRWNDPLFSVVWPAANPILSDQDAQWPLLSSIAPRR